MSEARQPGVRYVLPDADAIPGEPAPFTTRAGAFLVESAVAFALQVLALVPSALVAAMLAVIGADWLGAILTFVVAGMGPLIVRIWLEGKPQGQAYGKHLLRIAVVDAQTNLPGIGPGRSLCRQLAQILSALPLGLGFLWPLWDRQERTWHDIMTGTKVVRVADEKVLGPVAFLRRVGVPPVTSREDA